MRRAAARAASRRGSSSRMRPLPSQGRVEQRQRHQRRLAGTRRRDQHRVGFASKARQQFRQNFVDGQFGQDHCSVPDPDDRSAGSRGVGLVMRDEQNRQAAGHAPWRRPVRASAGADLRRASKTVRRASSMRGADSSARASATRAFWPPLSVSGSRSAMPARPTPSSAASAIARRAARALIEGGMANSRLPPTDICGNSSGSWNRMPAWRSSAGSAVRSTPPTVTLPEATNARSRKPPMKASKRRLARAGRPHHRQHLARRDPVRQRDEHTAAERDRHLSRKSVWSAVIAFRFSHARRGDCRNISAGTAVATRKPRAGKSSCRKA